MRYVAIILPILLMLCALGLFIPRLLGLYGASFVVDTTPPFRVDAALILGGAPYGRLDSALMLDAAYILYTEPKNYYDSKRLGALARQRGAKHRYDPSLDGVFISESSALGLALSYLGVEHAMVPSLKGGATSTRDEADDLADYLASHKEIKSLIIVTDAYHSARALWRFKRVLKRSSLLREDCPSEHSSDSDAASKGASLASVGKGSLASEHFSPSERTNHTGHSSERKDNAYKGGICLYIHATPSPSYDSTTWYRSERGLIDYTLESGKRLIYAIFPDGIGAREY